MQTPRHEQIYQDLYEAVVALIDQHPAPKLVYGRDFVDLEPDKLLIRTIIVEDAVETTYKLSVTTPEAASDFEWRAELTITSAEGELRHYLLREPPEVVEAYGRKVTPVSEAEVEHLVQEISNLEL